MLAEKKLLVFEDGMKKKALFITLIACAPLSALYALWNPFKASSYDSVKSGFESIGSDIQHGFQEGFSAKTWAPVGSFFKDTVYEDGLRVAGEKTHEYVYDKGLKVAADKIKNLVVGGWEEIKKVPSLLNSIADKISTLPTTLTDKIKPLDELPPRLTQKIKKVTDSVTAILQNELQAHQQKADIHQQMQQMPIQIKELEDFENILMNAFDELNAALKTLATSPNIASCSTTNITSGSCNCTNGTGTLCEMEQTLNTAYKEAVDGNNKIHGNIAQINKIVNDKACVGSLCYPTLPARLHAIAAAIDKVLP